MVTKTQAIKNVLNLASSPLAKLYTPEMEVQVNVASDNGIKKQENGKTFYFNDDERWYSFRLPISTSIDISDSALNFNLKKHAEGIGLSGWNFVKKQTEWVGFDVDSILNHKSGLNLNELNKFISIVMKIPYVYIYKSTSGKGYHLYIFFDKPIPSKDRSEHSAIAHAIINYLSLVFETDLSTEIDCMGSILWVWHRKQETSSDGLTLVKEGCSFDSTKLPINWKDYVGKRKKFHSMDKDIADLAISNATKLNENHRKLLKWFSEKAQYNWWFDKNFSMLVCHTLDLKSIHTEFKLIGLFETDSSGSSAQNCFCFPLKNDGWVVRRYTKGVKENPLWEVDSLGWTKIYFNVKLTLERVIIFRGGTAINTNSYLLNTGNKLNLVLQDIESNLLIPKELMEQAFNLKYKGNKIFISTKVNLDKYFELPPGWTYHKGEYCASFSYIEQSITEMEITNLNLDFIIRHLTSGVSEIGWCILNDKNEWCQENKSNIINVIQFKFPDFKQKDILSKLGQLIMYSWKLINEPFREEYPGERIWNKNAAQFAFEPLYGAAPTFFKVLEHLGTNIIIEDDWCLKNGITTGVDYLLMWIAFMFQKPYIPVPYLFFWSSEQNTGKSSFHEMLSLFFKDGIGYVRAEHCLTSSSGFNGELASAILCVVEELSLSGNSTAANKIKDWVTAKEIAIREMYQQVYNILNKTHWIQCNNNASACAVFPNDTRISTIHVSPLEETIPKGQLMQQLIEEAPCFLYQVLNMELPKPHSRLAIPALESDSKNKIMLSNSTPIEQFIAERIFEVPGSTIKFNEFFLIFESYLIQMNFHKKYSRGQTELAFSRKGIIFKHKDIIYNASFTEDTQLNKLFYLKDGRICQDE